MKNGKLTKFVLMCVLVALTVIAPSVSESAENLIPIRIGWNTTWATEGQVMCVLKHTNILELYGLKGEFLPFAYGGPLSEAALAGKIDVLGAADQPSITLLSKGVDWLIISRAVSFRDAILVPPQSGISNVTQLRGKKIAVPFGSGAHRITVEAMRDAGLTPGKDFELLNIDVAELNAMIKSAGGKAKEWSSGISGVASWDPYIAIHSRDGNAREVYQVSLVGLRSMSNAFIKKYPDAPVKYLKAVAAAILYYSKNQDLANKWFSEEARISNDSAIFNEAASYDSNIKAKSIKELNLGLDKKQIASLKSAADYAFEQKMIRKPIDIKAYLRLNYSDTALKELRKNPPKLNAVRIVQ